MDWHRFRYLMLVVLAWFASLPAVYAQDTPNIELEASRQGRLVRIHARALVRAPIAIIWETLTDYNNQARWIPGMSRSVVLERTADGAIVEQAGSVDVLFMRFEVDVVVRVSESFPDSLSVSLLRGNFRHLQGRYRIAPRPNEAGSFDLSWVGELEPDSRVPGMFTLPVLKDTIRHQFASMVQEIQRRTVP